MVSLLSRNWLKVAMIVAALALNYQHYIRRVADLDGAVLLLVYGGLFVVISAAILVAAFTYHQWARITWAAIFVSAGVFHDAFVTATGTFLTYESYVLMVQSMDFASAAIRQYASAVASALPVAFLMAVGIMMPPRYTEAWPCAAKGSLVAIGMPIAVAMGLSALMFVRGGQGSNGLPSPYVPLSLSILYAYDVFAGSQGTRSAVTISRATDETGRRFDIVYVIDESIRADYLDINHENGAYSGLADEPLEAQITNFGMAASATNCSIGSNLILRFGGPRDDYWRYIETMPSIWQYAKGAGLETVYVDAQSEDKLHNGMTAEEISQIDHVIQFKDVPPRDRDIAAAETLARLINDDREQFVLVNKLGAHFPIHDRYPDDYLIHTPALPRGEFAGAIIVQSIFGSSAPDWSNYKNAYKNTIRWNIGHFFEVLFSSANLDKAVILYTADHGQNFHERGEPGVATHCVYGGQASMEEGLVPIVTIAGNKLAQQVSMKGTPKNFNKTSHYNIFSTILHWMKYDPDQVVDLYGQPLMQTMKAPYTFNVHFNARFGASPAWVKIELDKVAYPTK